MTYFAKIESDIVTTVIVAEQDFVNSQTGTWVQTSDTGSIRKNFASVGHTYDATRDAFIPPQPYTSWSLNESTCRYEAPVTLPIDDNHYRWDESITNWKAVYNTTTQTEIE
tara:strand:+ start:368 stop:700 length:333 start_codon:yes stop_codon:yes gene_type:complete